MRREFFECSIVQSPKELQDDPTSGSRVESSWEGGREVASKSECQTKINVRDSTSTLRSTLYTEYSVE